MVGGGGVGGEGGVEALREYEILSIQISLRLLSPYYRCAILLCALCVQVSAADQTVQINACLKRTNIPAAG